MTTFSMQRLSRDDGTSLALYTWPAPTQPIKAAVQIAHGLAEHAGRYDRLAQALTQAGYAVFASDHRGHGQTSQPADYGFFAAQDGFDRVVADLYAVNRHIAAALPDVPRVLMGHSFGSFAMQKFLGIHGTAVSAAVLSGTNTGDAWMMPAAIALGTVERFRVGARQASPVLQFLTFGAYNKAFSPTRTDCDWLSRDVEEVDAYIADPACGFALATQGWLDLFRGLIAIEDRALQASIPKQLPIYLFAGDQDPVGHAGKGPRKLSQAYKRAGISHVTLKLYPGARHETLNEINRAEVTSDLIAWLDANVVAGNGTSRSVAS